MPGVTGAVGATGPSVSISKGHAMKQILTNKGPVGAQGPQVGLQRIGIARVFTKIGFEWVARSYGRAWTFCECASSGSFWTGTDPEKGPQGAQGPQASPRQTLLVHVLTREGYQRFSRGYWSIWTIGEYPGCIGLNEADFQKGPSGPPVSWIEL